MFVTPYRLHPPFRLSTSLVPPLYWLQVCVTLFRHSFYYLSSVVVWCSMLYALVVCSHVTKSVLGILSGRERAWRRQHGFQYTSASLSVCKCDFLGLLLVSVFLWCRACLETAQTALFCVIGCFLFRVGRSYSLSPETTSATIFVLLWSSSSWLRR